MKNYRAVFFDWDGTAVLSRKAPADEAVSAMKPLLAKGIKLVIVSGTTIENIAGGRLSELFTVEELSNLYLGLGRGAYDYAFDGQGQAYLFKNEVPDKKSLLDIHRIAFDVHLELLEKYDFPTDIVFSRPNYCKLDLMVGQNRGDNLFMQENELDMLRESLKAHGITRGLRGLNELAEEIGEHYRIPVKPTCDAKYLEIGTTSKSDNVDAILGKLARESGVRAEECAFWGDEYVGIEEGIYGSDSFMMTPLTKAGDFFDVSEMPGKRPEGVQVVGGKVERFLGFLRELGE